MSSYARRTRKEQEADYSTDHGWTMVDATNYGTPVSVASSFFLGCVGEINLNFP